jgi:hypothetical protein
MNQNKDFHIIPYCIYHYLEAETQIFYSYIDNPTKIQNLSTNIEFKCIPDSFNTNKWILYNTFYALSPMIRPIPNGLKLINSVRLSYYPYITQKIEYAYDPFNIEKNSVSFLTWTKPVSNSVPLYIHITPQGNCFPSFDENPPENKPGWSQALISPLFVLVDPETSGINLDLNNNKLPQLTKDKHGIPEFKFIERDNKCQPTNQGMSLEKCFLLIDKDLLDSKQYTSHTILEKISQLKNKPNKKVISKSFKNTIIITIIIVFLISLILSIIIIKYK